MSRFADQVFRERALLALVDPDGESAAIVPLSQGRARATWEHASGPPTRTRFGDDFWAGHRARGRDLLTRLGADPSREHGMIRCPAHEDRQASLSWRLASDGRALLHCFSGCDFASIVAAA